jgi:hypothetical protein
MREQRERSEGLTEAYSHTEGTTNDSEGSVNTKQTAPQPYQGTQNYITGPGSVTVC